MSLLCDFQGHCLTDNAMVLYFDDCKCAFLVTNWQVGNVGRMVNRFIDSFPQTFVYIHSEEATARFVSVIQEPLQLREVQINRDTDALDEESSRVDLVLVMCVMFFVSF